MSGTGDSDQAGHSPAPPAQLLLDRLFRAEAGRLMRFLQRRVGDADDALELVQEAFLRLAKVPPVGITGRPEAYLQRIARNLLVDRHRRRQARRTDHHGPLAWAEQTPAPAEQGWSLEAEELMERYQAALTALPERTREIFLLHRVDELTYPDIAARLGVTPRVVEYHVAKAMLHLHRSLRSE